MAEGEAVTLVLDPKTLYAVKLAAWMMGDEGKVVEADQINDGLNNSVPVYILSYRSWLGLGELFRYTKWNPT